MAINAVGAMVYIFHHLRIITYIRRLGTIGHFVRSAIRKRDIHLDPQPSIVPIGLA